MGGPHSCCRCALQLKRRIFPAATHVRSSLPPATHPALLPAVLEMSWCFSDAREDPAIGVIILTGEGPLAFCRCAPAGFAVLLQPGRWAMHSLHAVLVRASLAVAEGRALTPPRRTLALLVAAAATRACVAQAGTWAPTASPASTCWTCRCR